MLDQNHKLGRPKKEVKDPEGNTIPNLGCYERRNQKGKSIKTVYYSYYLDKDDLDEDRKPKRKRYYYKTPYPKVILEHRQRMALLNRPKEETIKMGFKEKEGNEFRNKIHWENKGRTGDAQLRYLSTYGELPVYDSDISIPKMVFLERVKAFLSDPIKAAEELGPGYEQVRKLNELPIFDKKVSLQELFDFYLERKKPCGQEKRGQKSAWDYFVNTIEKEYISEIGEDDIATFYKKTFDEAKKRKGVTNEPLWIRTKCMKIKTVLNTAKRFLVPQNYDVARVIEYWERHITDLPEPEVNDKPKAIPRDAFDKLINNSNLKFKTIYCLAVNCFFYAGDFPHLKKEDIFSNNEYTFIRMPRNKVQRRFDRLTCLTPETAILLKEYMHIEPNDTEYVFNGKKSNGMPNGKAISAKGIREYHNSLCKKLEIKNIGFKHCRDAVTHIRKLHPDIQNLSLGHKVSNEERVKYIEDMIDDAIEPMQIIRKVYFL